MAGEQSYELLIRLLDADTEEKELQEYYEQWGPIEDCHIVRHKDTKKSKGYGFIRYIKTDAVDSAMDARPHVLGGKTIEAHRCAPPEYAKKVESKHSCNDLYLGDVKPEVTVEDLKTHFSHYGTVTEVSIPKKDGGDLRGFAVVKFDDYDPVDVCAFRKVHYINKNRLFASKYIDKKTMNDLRWKYDRENYVEPEGNNYQDAEFDQTDLIKDLLKKQLAALEYQGSNNVGPVKSGRGGRRGGWNNSRGGWNNRGGRGGKKENTDEEWM